LFSTQSQDECTLASLDALQALFGVLVLDLPMNRLKKSPSFGALGLRMIGFLYRFFQRFQLFLADEKRPVVQLK
jgi:hypothetical protein